MTGIGELKLNRRGTEEFDTFPSAVGEDVFSPAAVGERVPEVRTGGIAAVGGAPHFVGDGKPQDDSPVTGSAP